MGTLASFVAADMDRVVAATTGLQRQAADPMASAWVAANAGTGKTHVLTQRVLRLLLAGTPPSRILCLTYTKAAAAEMSTRVFDHLAGWVGLSSDKLDADLTRMTGTTPDARTVALARTLFTAAIETPGGFQVQTIHAFAERLLQRFPLEAGVPPGFTILDEAKTNALRRDAIDATLRIATSDRDTPLGQALLTAVRYAADDTFDTLLIQACGNRELIAQLVVPRRQDSDRSDSDCHEAFADLEATLRGMFTVAPDADVSALRPAMADVFDDETLRQLVGVLAEGSVTEVKAASILRTALGAGQSTRIAAFRGYFLTGKSTARDDLMTKGTAVAYERLAATATRAQAEFIRLHETARALDMVNATVALYRLAAHVHSRFIALKSNRAALDFDDLIERTSALFQSHDSASWVLYKLDGGIDHVLVDEAQDTSPAQWRIVGAIVQEFFGDAGAGPERAGVGRIGVGRIGADGSNVGRASIARTVFAVGDEKQSIYSFQGAAPEMFAANGRHFEALARGAGCAWHPAALTLSWRTVSPVLDLVDATFANADRTPGLTADAAHAIRHQARRAGHAGLVEIWPLEEPDEASDTDAWSPLDEDGRTSPALRLADRIAETIRTWLDRGERLESEDRPVRAGDILVLVRKRNPFAPAIVAALKKRDIPVAGTDRITLSGQLAVQDLMALGDFLTLPEDDLALANVLKGPLFGLDDDDLLLLAHGRKGTLWKALLDAGSAVSTAARFATAADQLKRWRSKADFLPPFEFFAHVLDRDGGRHKLLTRLGPEAADPLDEFMNLAVRFDDQAPPSLTGFLGWLREDERTIKRDMEQGRDEVRVLTVHGAKGLEAPIVFLPDTCSNGANGRGARLIPLSPMQLPDGAPMIAVWPVAGAKGLPAIERAKADVKAAETEEANRLLYVAMTRPRDRLYIAGARGAKKLPDDCWYQTITAALTSPAIAARVETVCVTAAGSGETQSVRRISAAQTEPPTAPKRSVSDDVIAARRPAWLFAPAPREVRPVIPFAPSRLAPYDHDTTGEPAAHTPELEAQIRRQSREETPPTGIAPIGAPNSGVDTRLLRGTLTHALLQHLPSLPRQTWPVTADGFLDLRGAALPVSARRDITRETIAVLSDPVFAPLFERGSRAEVPIIAEIADPTGRSPPLMLNGQIDRLAIDAHRVLIVDYKTNRVAPTRVEDVEEAYLVQLAAYRVALAKIFPGRDIRAALLWTQTARLMEIPTSILDTYAARLFELATRPLDLDGLPS